MQSVLNLSSSSTKHAPCFPLGRLAPPLESARSQKSSHIGSLAWVHLKGKNPRQNLTRLKQRELHNWVLGASKIPTWGNYLVLDWSTCLFSSCFLLVRFNIMVPLFIVIGSLKSTQEKHGSLDHSSSALGALNCIFFNFFFIARFTRWSIHRLWVKSMCV